MSTYTVSKLVSLDVNAESTLRQEIARLEKLQHAINMREFLRHIMMQREECEYQNQINTLSEELADTQNQIQVIETDARIYDIDEMQQEINMMLAALDARKVNHSRAMQ